MSNLKTPYAIEYLRPDGWWEAGEHARFDTWTEALEAAEAHDWGSSAWRVVLAREGEADGPRDEAKDPVAMVYHTQARAENVSQSEPGSFS